MDVRDAWSGAPVLSPAPSFEPSLELGEPAGWNASGAPDRLLGEIELAATPAAVRPARTYVRELVGACFIAVPAVVGDLELLTSEAVTRAVLHAGARENGRIRLCARYAGRCVRVEVTGGGLPRSAPPRPDDPLAVAEWGPYLIEALATETGTRRHPGGGWTFWFALAVGDGWKVL
ncbi:MULTISPECIES: ATP-binding protein [Actinomadura]|uniref:ATP-binding protein n=1 Tax=Actinomadura yumaensis TaxID=111807 RepID=A0ABW2CQF4_9ACTN|nr:ATP-binding protein [Actinomadura sp. J1-007]